MSDDSMFPELEPAPARYDDVTTGESSPLFNPAAFAQLRGQLALTTWDGEPRYSPSTVAEYAAAGRLHELEAAAAAAAELEAALLADYEGGEL